MSLYAYQRFAEIARLQESFSGRSRTRFRAAGWAGLCVVTMLLFVSPAPAAETQAANDDSSRGRPEEVIVRGEKSLRTLRLEVEEAKERVYDVFNQHNSDDALDIRCSDEPRPGSRIRQRTCRGRYVDDATHRSGRDFVQLLQSSCPGGLDNCEEHAGDAEAVFYNAAPTFQEEKRVISQMNRVLEDEMRRLVTENPEVAAAFEGYLAKERELREALEHRE